VPTAPAEANTSVDAPEESASAQIDPETPEERQKRLADLATHIGPWIRSLVERDSVTEPSAKSVAVDSAARAAESADKKIVVFQLSGPMRQTYALIPLTPAMDAAISPMKPLLANGGLEAIANSLASLLDPSNNVQNPDAAPPVEAELQPSAASPDSDSPVALTEEPQVKTMPDWIDNPDGGRIVVKTAALLPGDDDEQPLSDAINQALSDHVVAYTESLDPALHTVAKTVKLKLDPETALRCRVDRHERVEVMETSAGPKPIRVIYALVEFPESVDKAALTQIRQTLQQDRVFALGATVLLAWLTIVSATCGLRLFSKGSILRRSLSMPIFALLTIPFLLFSTILVIKLARNEIPRPDWSPALDSISIHVPKDL
jgi:hypothetical protein